ncbi:MAG: class A beta-lactamase, subclass A2 [bacterium]|nr:class A beta-lactamase, subclass A2 [bacterium]
MRNHSFFLFLFLLTCFNAKAQHVDSSGSIKHLADSIINLVSKYKATIGVSIIALEDKETTLLNNDKRFPMQSVYKFHLALAVLKQVDDGILKLNQQVFVKKLDLRNTWSPMKDKYPEGNFSISVADLLTYSISRSDNNACDILFNLVGGTKKVDQYIRSLGFKTISIAATEYQMSKKWSTQFKNNTTPLAMGELLAAWFQKEFLSDSSTQFLNRILVENYTSNKRLKGLLPDSIIVAHKTGTSGSNEKGISAGTNDVGVVTLPDGKHLFISVFVSNSSEIYETNERIIAEIAYIAFKHYTQ